MLLPLNPLPPAVLLWEGDSRHIGFGASCAWRVMMMMIHLMFFFQPPMTAQRHCKSRYCRERREDVLSGQGQRGRGWIALFDNTKKEIGKCNSDRKHTTCPVPPALLHGLGQILLAIEDALGPHTGSGLFGLLLGFIIPGVKINNNKLAWPSRPWKRPDLFDVCSYSAKSTSELFISTFWPDWQHHIRVRFSTEILFQTLLRGLLQYFAAQSALAPSFQGVYN